MQTATGGKFDFDNMQMADIDIADIAIALSNICRFNGHTKDGVFYSVAQHSVHVMEIVAKEDLRPRAQLTALMHDAAEAYTQDITKPLREHIGSMHKKLETSVHSLIALKFGMYTSGPCLDAVKVADMACLAAESQQVMAPPPSPWHLPYPAPAWLDIAPWPNTFARRRFLQEFTRLQQLL